MIIPWIKRLLVFGVALSMAGSFFNACLSALPHGSGSAIIWVFILGLAILVFLAWLRFRNHRQKLDSLFQAKPTSAKRRVDR